MRAPRPQAVFRSFTGPVDNTSKPASRPLFPVTMESTSRTSRPRAGAVSRDREAVQVERRCTADEDAPRGQVERVGSRGTLEIRAKLADLTGPHGLPALGQLCCQRRASGERQTEDQRQKGGRRLSHWSSNENSTPGCRPLATNEATPFATANVSVTFDSGAPRRAYL